MQACLHELYPHMYSSLGAYLVYLLASFYRLSEVDRGTRIDYLRFTTKECLCLPLYDASESF